MLITGSECMYRHAAREVWIKLLENRYHVSHKTERPRPPLYMLEKSEYEKS